MGKGILIQDTLKFCSHYAAGLAKSPPSCPCLHAFTTTGSFKTTTTLCFFSWGLPAPLREPATALLPALQCSSLGRTLLEQDPWISSFQVEWTRSCRILILPACLLVYSTNLPLFGETELQECSLVPGRP